MRNSSNLGSYAAAIFIMLVFTLPILWMFMGAFKTPVDIYSIPPVWWPDFTYLDNFKTLFAENWKFLLNSVIITLGATVLCMIFALPCAFGLVNFQFKTNNFLADWILSTRMMPPIAAAVPLFMIFNGLGMLDTHLALIIVYAGFNLPFAVWVAMSFFRNLPKEIIEAARIEGCTWWQTFWPVVISGFSTLSRTYWEFVSAATVIQVLPPIIFTLIMQRHIVSGLTMGAVKNG